MMHHSILIKRFVRFSLGMGLGFLVAGCTAMDQWASDGDTEHFVEYVRLPVESESELAAGVYSNDKPR